MQPVRWHLERDLLECTPVSACQERGLSARFCKHIARSHGERARRLRIWRHQRRYGLSFGKAGDGLHDSVLSRTPVCGPAKTSRLNPQKTTAPGGGAEPAPPG